MIETLLDKLQNWCDQLENPTAKEVAELMRREKVVIHQADLLSDNNLIIGSRFEIQDTMRTKTSPDGHFSAHYVTAVPVIEGQHRRWRFQKGRPNHF